MTVAVSKPAPITAQGTHMLSARKKLDVITACREVSTYRGAAEMCGVTHKTVKRIVEAEQAAAERTLSSQELRERPRPGGREGRGHEGQDQREAVAARGDSFGLCGVGPELPAPGREGEDPVSPTPSDRRVPPAGALEPR